MKSGALNAIACIDCKIRSKLTAYSVTSSDSPQKHELHKQERSEKTAQSGGVSQFPNLSSKSLCLAHTCGEMLIETLSDEAHFYL